MYIVGIQTHTPVTPYSDGNQNPTGKTSFAEMLRQEQSALESVTPEDTAPAPDANGVGIALEALELATYEDLEDFNTRFQSLLAQYGIDTAQKIELGHEPGSGKVIVRNEHPDKEKIEALFEEDRSLRNEFTKITSMLNLVEAVKRATEFKRAYAIDPQQAVADFASLLQTTHVDVSISFENGDCEVSARQVPNSPGTGAAKFTPYF